MNVSSVKTKDYEQITMNNEPIKTNPNKANLRSNKMNTTFLLTKDYEQITMNNEPIKTNPISEESKMSLTHYMTKEYENKSGLSTMEKQTQSNPIYSELACTEQGRSVEPISNVPLQKWGITRVDWFFAMTRGWRWIIGKGGLFYNVSFVLFPGISEGTLLCSAFLPGCARGCGSATLR